MLTFPGKIPVSIYPFFWALALFIGWINTSTIPGTLIWASVILVSVLAHEFGHALTAVLFGQKARIELLAFGGVTHRHGKVKLSLWKEFFVVLNGPLIGFCLAGIAWWFYSHMDKTQTQSMWAYAVQVALEVNFYWTILNLFPIQPLDGGKLLTIVLESIFGLKGVKISLFISLLLSAGFGLFFFSIQQFYFGAFFMFFAFESYKLWTESLSLTENDADVDLLELLKSGDSEAYAGNHEKALGIYHEIREKSKAGLIYQTATENAARLLFEQKQLEPAYEMLSRLGKNMTTDGLILLHRLAFNLKLWKESAALGDKTYRERPSYQIAAINAISHAALGQVKPTIGWIQRAIQDGMPHAEAVVKAEEFNGIRNDPAFREFLAQLRPQTR